ncbi:hypothetical protein H2O73_10830 [Vibrio sp. 404]|uniref:Uncharacterized protein n=1 Tax=Vibrio marinisediminis TaxID=2758441 RepID=A0A7W2FRB7_9VIBR|nr:hypothetical protein [Vibrio marinisediminis]MBA5762840.1 hypothetical protein [Vibrio marinisediminis]
MQVAFLHTLAANETLFDGFIQRSRLPNFATVVHHSAPQLLEYASQTGLDEVLAAQVAQQVLQLEAQGADWIVCTCSSIGRMAEQAQTKHARVIRVDRPMAIVASKAKQLTVLAALETTIEPTMSLLAEYPSQLSEQAQVVVIPQAWQHYLNGKIDTYSQTIADYIVQKCIDDECVVLAQASMSPALSLLAETLQARVLTSPKLCIDFLIAELGESA